jgi:sugar phosphate isomerase/epimerase
VTDPGRDDLVLANYSLPRGIDFEQRVRAAAEAGFVGIGLSTAEYLRCRAEGQRDVDLRAVLEHYGQRVLEIEVLRGWSSTTDRHRYLESERAVCSLSDALGPAHHVQVLGPYEGDLDQAAQALAEVCDRIADHGLRAAIEFLPEMTNIPDAAVAWEIARRADRPNAGLCVDSWHHFRGANAPELLRQVPPDRVFAVQIDDGPAVRVDADYYTDCTRYREVPGEGAFDLVGFLQQLTDLGVRQPLSVEVLSDGLRKLPPGEAARRMADGTRRVLAQAKTAGR